MYETNIEIASFVRDNLMLIKNNAHYLVAVSAMLPLTTFSGIFRAMTAAAVVVVAGATVVVVAAVVFISLAEETTTAPALLNEL